MSSPMPSTTASSSSRELMSALADGEGDAQAAARRWADDADARQAWHTYHLIGDVLRSDDLAVVPGRDAEFLARLRVRLAAEPPIVAPLPAAALPAARARRRWMAPAAVAAGFMAVAGVLVMTRAIGPLGEGGVPLAAAPASQVLPSGAIVVPVVAGAAATDAPAPVANGQLIRDARLDQYLRAHRGSPGVVPGAAIGRVEAVVLER